MTNLDFSKFVNSYLATQPAEENIAKFKSFYREHLLCVRNRESVLPTLSNLVLRYRKLTPKLPLLTDPEKEQLNKEADDFLRKNFPKRITELFNQKIHVETKKRILERDETKPWLSVVAAAAIIFDVDKEMFQKEISYKVSFLENLYSCLYNYGLHPDINNRNLKLYKRYNIILQHDFKTRNRKSLEIKNLINLELLEKDFLKPYEKKIPIKINGTLIPFKNLIRITITSTLLLDDEIDLFMLKNNLSWDNSLEKKLAFSSLCNDETDELINNPFLIELKKESTNLYLVNPIRINELRRIKNQKFDLIKLIQLCEELNSASLSNNLISPTLIARAIIDHVPPIFGKINFTEVANNYSGPTSFKKSMRILDESLRNIADGNIHGQIRNKEVLPTQTQYDFSQNLDLLLSEIVRILK